MTNYPRKYFEWMCQLVYDPKCTNGKSYNLLLNYLNHVDFIYILDMDENREVDGLNLRYRFEYDNGYSNGAITKYLNTRGCSVLEMMIALALRCEEQFMFDPDFGNRTGQWFWKMISNLGLMHMDDDNFDSVKADDIIETFLYRKYDKDGNGGLFFIPGCKRDLRDVEIWCQMTWYINMFP